MKLLPMIGLFALLVLPGRAQERFMGMFPHYAAGGGWSSTIYFAIPGISQVHQEYRFEFMNQRGHVLHNSRFTINEWNGVLELRVPEFAGSAIASGIINVYCRALPGSLAGHCNTVLGGHLLFGLRTERSASQSSIPFITASAGTVIPNRTVAVDTRRFVYGIALYNDDTAPGFITLDMIRGGGQPPRLGLGRRIAIGAKEHRAFLLSDLYGDIPPQLYALEISVSPLMRGFVIMQFSEDGSFSQTPVVFGPTILLR